MEVLLVRHGHAGRRDRWGGDDRLRPLSARGRREAAALVDLLAPYRIGRILSSPLLRCVQTVEPLAAHLGVPVELSEALGPRADREAARLLRSFRSGPCSVLVCTHGETIEALQRSLASPGDLAFGPSGPREKGSVWVLGWRGRRLAGAAYLPPVRGRGGSMARETPDGRTPRGSERVPAERKVWGRKV